jgi:hypothetical protein
MRALVLLTAFLLSLASPARAADDVAAAQTVIRSQVEALGRDDAEGVPWEALYTLEEQPDGSVKIIGCVLLKAGQAV